MTFKQINNTEDRAAQFELKRSQDIQSGYQKQEEIEKQVLAVAGEELVPGIPPGMIKTMVEAYKLKSNQ